ncbi:hypothetical protein C7820_5149 [Paenibacillus sp. VMFN-D1]|nr:hypothetical protein C7820_5149 [Paenibacillus sp. VMFN-D1]
MIIGSLNVLEWRKDVWEVDNTMITTKKIKALPVIVQARLDMHEAILYLSGC